MKKMKFVLLSTLLLTSGLFTSCNNTSKVDVMVVGVKHPTFKETEVLIEKLTNKSTRVIDNLNFYIGNIGKKRVVIAETPFGTSEAAMATTIGIKHYSPKYVISEGSAGGHHNQVHPLDVILGKEILDIASYHGDPLGDPKEWELQNPNLKSDDELLEIASTVENKFGNRIDDGVIASSDAWNTGVEFVTKLQGKFKEDCEEMESYAVANVCDNYKTPFLAIKMLSNNLITNENDRTACSKVQEYTIDVINAI